MATNATITRTREPTGGNSVAIVGAGPTAVMPTLEVARGGVNTSVLDRLTGPSARFDALRRRLWPAVAVACLCGVLASIWVGAQPEHRVAGRGFGNAIPLLARGEVSRVMGQDLPGFAAARAPGGFRIRNDAQRLAARFVRDRVLVRSGPGGWLALSLRGVGYPGRLLTLGPVAPRAHANVITYPRGLVTEWYANGPLGLEQGFSLARRPPGRASGPLALTMRVSGSLRASLRRSGASFGSGRGAVTYTRPVASDASGRSLPAWLELRGGTLVVRVDDRGARYPLLIDPFLRAATLHASDATPGSSFGLDGAIAASDDTIVVGARAALVGTSSPGAVYVFTKPSSGWADAVETAKLTASDGGAGDGLGASVGVSGNTIVAGAPGATAGSHIFQGAVYVFTKDPERGWVSGTETAKLTASDGRSNDLLGGAVAIDGNTIVAGAAGGNVSATAKQGAVYVFTMPTSGWRSGTEAAKLSASDGAVEDFLGQSVAISGQTVAASSASGVYVFAQPSGGWSGQLHEQAKLTVPGETPGQVAIDDATIAAEFSVPGVAAGPVEVFVEPAGGWTSVAPVAQLTPSNFQVTDGFGGAIAIRGTRIVVGAQLESLANTSQAGAVYVYDEPSAGWASETESARLTEPTPGQNHGFGSGVGIIDDTTLVAAAPLTTVAGVQQGLAYVFTGPAAPPPPGGTTTTTQPSPTTTTPPPPPPPPPGCLRGYDAKYPDFPLGLGVGADYELTDPSMQANGTVEQTVAFGLSTFKRWMYATTGGCWALQRRVPGVALNGYSLHEEFGTYGDVNLDGVILVPVNARGGGSGPAELHVSTDGTIYATGGDTRYSVEVVQPDGTRLVVGRVDLGASPWHWDGGLTSLIGRFGPAPDGPRPFGRPLVGGVVTSAGVGIASVTAYVQLPSLFSGTPDGGPAPTANLSYGPFSNPSAPSAPAGGGGGGGGGTLGAGGCNPQTSVHCTHNLATGDHVRAAVASGGPGGSGGAAAVPLHLTVPELYLGALRLSDVFLDYDPTRDLWSGGGDAQLGELELRAAPPPPDNGLGLRGDGSFDHGGASLSVPGGVPLFPGVNLTELGVTFALEPTRLSGDATVSVAGGLVTLHGGVFVVFANHSHPYTYQPLALPGIQKLQTDTQRTPITSTAIGVAGTVSLQFPVIGNLDLANGYVFYIAPSYFEFAGHFSFGVFGLGLDGDVTGALDTGSGRFSLAGDGHISIELPNPIGKVLGLGVEAAISTAGFGACGQITIVHPFDFGFRYLYSGGLTIYVDGCDLGKVKNIDLRAARDARGRAAAAAGGVSFALPAGLPSASVTVTGAGGPPGVTIAGPHGERASSDPTGRALDAGRFVILPLPDQHETVIGIEHPAAGRWTITPQPGSPPITAVSEADGLPAARVTATVISHAGRDRLAYRILPRAGQTVTFAERGGQVFHVLGQAQGATGTLTFTPADAPTRNRQLVALISLSGVPSQTVVAGSYTAPPPPRPDAPRRVRVTRHGRTLLITWSPALHARAYAVTVALSDGQRLAVLAAGTRQTTAVNAPAPGLGARVTVQGIAPDGNAGPPRTAQLSQTAAPPRVRGITATRTRAGVLIHWRPVPGAVRYFVTIVVAGPGGPAYQEESALPHLAPSVDLARLRRGGTATITVKAMSADANVGPATQTTYKPQPTRRQR